MKSYNMCTGSTISGLEGKYTIPSFRHLPNKVVKEIFRQIPDQSTLLDARLVCVHWNLLIENTSELMKKITFPIWHIKPFLDLDIVKRKKVKSIKFMNPLRLYPGYDREKFIDLITDTIEKVEFAYVDPSLPYQAELFKLVLENCGRLEELTLSYATRRRLNSLETILQSNIPTIKIAAVNILCVISLYVGNYKEEDVAGLADLLLQLPNLKEIKISGLRRTEKAEIICGILAGLCEYIKNYDTKLHLKVSSSIHAHAYVKNILHILLTSVIYYIAEDNIRSGRNPRFRLL